MANKSSIEWTEATWNPVTGCTKISPGCAHCYAERFSERFRGVPGHPYEQGFDFKLWPQRLSLPLQWVQPRLIFVNSMSDLFHEAVPIPFIEKVFEVMESAKQHVFQLLTKRSSRLVEFVDLLPWPENLWVGVSVENQRWTHRVDDLRNVPAAVRFLSCEPLLGPLEIDMDGIDWVIVGGESGPRARAMKVEWARSIRDQCHTTDTPFFFKQWGAHDANGTRVGRVKSGRLLDGETWDEFPIKWSA